MVRSVRERLGLTQPQLGQLVGAHAVTVSRWETEALQPTPFQLDLIRHFDQAARRKGADEIGTILATAGPMVALLFLLKWALEPGHRLNPGGRPRKVLPS